MHVKDTHGSVIGLAGKNGTKLDTKYDYDAFGNQLYDEPNPFGYCGEYYDRESGNIYLRARYYDSNIGRFISEDPVKDGLNWYSYCGGNPVSLVDPSGLEYIVVSGGKYNYSRESGKYNYEFIETAIKKLIELKELKDGEGITWMITADGWSEEEKSVFYGIANYIEVGVKWVNNEDDFVNYINTKDDGNRASDKIHKFVVFSHGYDVAHESDEHGTMELGAGISFSVDDINNKLWATAFDNPNTALYSCSLGTYGDNSFAQAWVNKFGGKTWAFVGKSYYGDINNGNDLESRIAHFYELPYVNGSANYPRPGNDPIIDGPYAGWASFMTVFTRK